MYRLSKPLSLVAAVLVLSILACSQSSSQPVTTPASKPTATLPAKPTKSSKPVVAPNATPVSLAGPDIHYNGVIFTLDRAVGKGVSARLVPEVPLDKDMPVWAGNPEYTGFTITGYAVRKHNFQPQISVYSVETYIAFDENAAAEVIKPLQKLLVDQPETPKKPIPILPVPNAAQVFRARVHYINFQNGSAVCFVTEYAQAITAIANDAAFYTCQGLTDDGVYYVSAFLPINAAVLGADSEDFGDYKVDLNANNFSEQYKAYIDGMTEQVEQLAPDDFTPGLDVVDQVIKSVSVGPLG